ncbi:methionyl-tRNA formyltransferase [Pedobacter sp. SYP-B3415]|uniref:methionyl-tRNA formyltransferase n=1 Tax=Pedobacter sp. SYP-B3415 TaxID=2496641 RepID=UPI00101D8AEE|nr:methionyl-tRNA formyltransferase [Pedobacter sp. SYP-B3415]
MRIVFMGTPDFAVASLKALIDGGFEVVAVVTAADKPAGRGQKLQQSAVKRFAVEHDLPVLQPEKLRDPAFLESLADLKADLQVVVAFRMLPEVVWNMPPKGTINLHASLLPQYRGAAPINHAIINGEQETGVTTFFLQHEIDTGATIRVAKVAIDADETAGSLHDKLMQTGAQVLVDTVRAIADGTATGQQQPETGELKHAPKIFKDFCKINWDQPVATVYNHIRGLSPYPAAFTELNGKTLKIFGAAIDQASQAAAPGTFLTDGKTFLKFAARNGHISVTDLQYEGKKRMPVEDFLRGVRL